MNDLQGRYQRLRSELDAAYEAPVWDSSRIDRIADEIIPIELELLSQRTRESNLREHGHV